MLFESYGVFTPLQLVLAVVKIEAVCQWSWTVKNEFETCETKNYPKQIKVIAMNPISPNIEPQPSAQCRKAVAGSFLKTILAVLLLAVAMEGPVLAQTTNAADDGTVLKQIIIFGRHSIRASVQVTPTN